MHPAVSTIDNHARYEYTQTHVPYPAFGNIVIDKALGIELLVFSTQLSQLRNEWDAFNGSSIEQTVEFYFERRNVNHSFRRWSIFLLFLLRNGRGFFLGVKYNVASIGTNSEIDEQETLGTAFIKGL